MVAMTPQLVLVCNEDYQPYITSLSHYLSKF